MGQKATLPFCIWADPSTSGNVAETNAREVSKMSSLPLSPAP